jgi:atypical dual specificity phosphatase
MCAYLDEQKRGERAFVHCKAGHGRSAAVALCWLMTQHPKTASHVLNQRLRDKRKVRKTLYKQASVKAFAKEQAGRTDSED